MPHRRYMRPQAGRQRFRLDVVKIESEDDLRKETERLFKQSELPVAQEWLPSEFDWRTGGGAQRPAP